MSEHDDVEHDARAAGATTTTDTSTDGRTGQPHSVWVVKNTTAETYAWAPKARLNTPEVV